MLRQIEIDKQKELERQLELLEEKKQDKLDETYLNCCREGNEQKLFYYTKKFNIREKTFQDGFVAACELGIMKIVSFFVNVKLKWALRKKKEEKYNQPQIIEKLTEAAIIRGYYQADLADKLEICRYLLKMIKKSKIIKNYLLERKILKDKNEQINDQKLKIYH